MSHITRRSYQVGEHIAAINKDGILAPATIEVLKSVSINPEDDIYVVRFNDNTTACYSTKNMIGTKPFSDFCMQPYQKVYTTHNGREVSGYIQRYLDDHILISIPGASEEKEIISKKPNEIRLLDYKRSSKFQPVSFVVDGQARDDNSSNGRAVSASIAVPEQTRRIRRTSEEPTMNELMAAMVLSNLSSSPVFHNQPKGSPQSYGSSGVESWTHDSKHTSPSRHSSLRNTPAHTADSEMKEVEGVEGNRDLHRSRTPDDVLDTGSGMILLQRSTPTPTKQNSEKESVKMEEDANDEPQDLSVPKVHVEEAASRPRSRTTQVSSSYSERGKLDVVMEQQEDQQKNQPAIPITLAMPIAISPQIPISYYLAPGFLPHPFLGSLPAEFKVNLASTPPLRSTEVGSSAPGHIDSKMHRYSHRIAPYQKVGDDSAVSSPASGSSPSAQMLGSPPSALYHLPTTPIPVSSLSFSPSHHRKHTRSPLATKAQSSLHSPSVQVTRTPPVSVPTASVGYPILPNIPFAPTFRGGQAAAGHKAFSWHGGAAPNFLSKPFVEQRQPQQRQNSSPKTLNLSPKSSLPIGGRKVRGDGKKCRKVYGMDHRDMWCTACRWKKACQRFPD